MIPKAGAALIATGLWLAEALPKFLSDGLGAVALTAAGVAGLGYLLRLLNRSRKTSRAFFHRIQGGLDIVEGLPAWKRDVNDRLDRHAAALDLMAETDKHRIKDAIAGDPRSPVDRRAA